MGLDTTYWPALLTVTFWQTLSEDGVGAATSNETPSSQTLHAAQAGEKAQSPPSTSHAVLATSRAHGAPVDGTYAQSPPSIAHAEESELSWQAVTGTSGTKMQHPSSPSVQSPLSTSHASACAFSWHRLPSIFQPIHSGPAPVPSSAPVHSPGVVPSWVPMHLFSPVPHRPSSHVHTWAAPFTVHVAPSSKEQSPTV